MTRRFARISGARPRSQAKAPTAGYGARLVITTCLGLAFAGEAKAQDPTPAPAGEGDVEIEDYIIQKGDSCVKIARRRFGNGKRYDLIHKYNPDMGPTPHRLVPGEILRLPRTAEYKGADAEVTHTHRDVQARASREETWGEASVGLDLYKGWRVNTLERAAAEVTFRDTSVVQLRANTLVIIYGATRGQSKRSTMRATLENGALRTRLGELGGAKRMEVETPGAQTSLEGGETLVTVDESATSRVANHGAGKASVKAKGKRVDVGPRMGSKVKKGAAPTPPKPLPPEPAWAAGQPGTFVGLSGLAGTLRGGWAEVAEAEAYLVQVSRKPDGRDVVASVVVPKDVRDFELRGFAPGDYYVQISSIDDDAFESPPTAPRPFKLVELSLAQPGGAEVMLGESSSKGEAGSDTAAPRPRVLPGTQLVAPQGLLCSDGHAPPAATYTLAQSGTQTVACVTTDDQPAPGFEVEVVAISLATAANAEVIEVQRGAPVRESFALASDIDLPPTLRLRAPAGIEVSDATRQPDGSYAFELTADDQAPSEGEIEVLLGPEGGDADAMAVISRVPFKLATPAPVQAPEPPPSGRKRLPFELGVLGGVYLPPGNHQLAEAGISERPALARVAPAFGFRFAYLPIDYLAIEAEYAGMPTKTAGDRSTFVIGLRGLVSGQLATKVTPVVSVGAGMIGVLSDPSVLGRDFDAAFVFGGGIKAYPVQSLGLRLEVRDSLTPGFERAVANNWELLFSLSWNFGASAKGSRGGR